MICGCGTELRVESEIGIDDPTNNDGEVGKSVVIEESFIDIAVVVIELSFIEISFIIIESRGETILSLTEAEAGDGSRLDNGDVEGLWICN